MVGTSRKSDKSIFSEQKKPASVSEPHQEASTFQAQEPTNLPQPPAKTVNHSGQSKLAFRAKQVLERDNGKEGKKALPTGSNLIGKLLTAIDSRDLSSPIKVLLPYGGKFQSEQFIEKNTILLGKANYSGKGERIFISFDRAILPSGQERSITASALDSSDYSNGIVGDVHSETGMRIAGSLGLTMVSSMSDVLTEKTAHGESGVVIPKANMRNAAFQGISKVSSIEASRQAETIAQTPPYITLDAGIDLIITLGAFYGTENEQ